MNDDQVTRTFEQIERALRHEDPAFIQRLQHVHRQETVIVLSVFISLAVGAVLLAVGLATLSWPNWATGLMALVTSALIDAHHKRGLQLHPAHSCGAGRGARWCKRHGR